MLEPQKMTKLNQAPNAKLSVEVVRLSRPAGTVCLGAAGQRLTAAAWWLLHSNLSRLEALCYWVVRLTVHLPILVTSLKKLWRSFSNPSTLTCCSEVVRGQRSSSLLNISSWFENTDIISWQHTDFADCNLLTCRILSHSIRWSLAVHHKLYKFVDTDTFRWLLLHSLSTSSSTDYMVETATFISATMESVDNISLSVWTLDNFWLLQLSKYCMN